MTRSIRERADIIATFRSVSVQTMELLARWVPTTAELEAKVLFGRHIWDFAQHADALGKRTAELRAALHYTLTPTAEFQRALDTLAGAEGTASRVSGLYDGWVPSLAARYRTYVAQTDATLDEPSVRIIERILADLTRLTTERARLPADRPEFGASDEATAERVRALATAPEDFVRYRPPIESAETA